MPRRLPSSALDSQTQLTASGTGAVLAGTWYIGTGGAGSGGAVAGTLNGPLTGTADSAKVLTPGKALNGTTFTGADAITVPLNTTSIATSGTYYPAFVPSNTAGNQQASTHASLSYDPNTGFLSATRFVGSGAGLTGVVTSVSFNGAAAVNGAVSITSPAQVQPDWNATTGLGSILNKPALFSGSYTDLSSKPTLFDGAYSSLTGKPTLFDGAYSSLSGIPAAPVTSVNGSTGAVTVSTLLDSFNASSYFNVQQMYKSITIEPGGYLGDKFASTGLQTIPGITITNFFSTGNVDAESGAFSYTVSFSITYSQAWFDTYAPGYNASHLRMAVVRPGDLAYGTYWVGYPTTTNWTIGCSQPNHVVTESLTGFSNPTSTTSVTWTTIDGGYVSGQGLSPWIWPSRLKLTTYFAR